MSVHSLTTGFKKLFSDNEDRLPPTQRFTESNTNKGSSLGCCSFVIGNMQYKIKLGFVKMKIKSTIRLIRSTKSSCWSWESQAANSLVFTENFRRQMDSNLDKFPQNLSS